MEFDFTFSLFILSLVFVFAYQFSIFVYASDLLAKCSKNKLVFLLFSLFNTLFFFFYQMFSLHPSALILFSFVSLLIEFRLIAKTSFIQIFCGTAIFVLHIAALIVPLSTIFANIVGVSPLKLLDNTIFDHIIVIASCTILILAQELVKKHIDNTSIQRVSTQPKYSVILFISTILVVLFQLAHSVIIIDDNLYIEQVLLSVAVSLSSLFTFYLFFLYAIGLINTSLYKRYSDKEISEQEKIHKQKETLINKTERDDLTGVFNRRYIMSTLEKLCSNDSKGMFALLFIDVNGLKSTNDTHGHEMGDLLLKKVVEAVMLSIREQDIVARIGGDEFLVIINDLLIPSCEEIIQRINHHVTLQDKNTDFMVSASIGSAIVDDELKKQGHSYILSLADEDMRKNKALFYAKQNGGNGQ